MNAAEYHAETDSLSSSGARLLLPPNCPALFKWRQDNPPEPKDVFDFGHAAHRLVLGDGPDVVPVLADDWRSKAAREQRDFIREGGKVPLLAADYDRVHGMAGALRQHPIASALFSRGKPEQVLRWQDAETGVQLRAMLDWLPEPQAGRLVIPDYKTARSANPADFARSAASYGYAVQDAWYRAAVKANGLDDDPRFLFVVQEKNPPYLVSVVELDAVAQRIGEHLMRKAIHTYAECKRTDTWPGYADGVEYISLPAWYEREHEDEIEMDMVI